MTAVLSKKTLCVVSSTVRSLVQVESVTVTLRVSAQYTSSLLGVEAAKFDYVSRHTLKG